MQDIEDFNYFFLIKNNVLLIHREIKKVIYKTTFDKISRYIDYTSKIIRKFVNNASKQIYLLFGKCLQEKIQLI